MDSILFLIPISIIFLTIAIITLVWNIKSGQFDDMEAPAHKILFDDDENLLPDDAKPVKKEDDSQPKDTN
jgi:cbb3-type cytochrome oxidase maturation protein